MKKKPKKTILIEASGGLVDAVYSDSKDTEVLLVDWDEVEAAQDKEDGAIPVAKLPLTPMRDIPSSTLKILLEHESPPITLLQTPCNRRNREKGGKNLKGTKVMIREDILIQLHQLGKAEDKSLSVQVDEILRAGLKSRSATAAL
jgi:hypothetical protein